MARAVTRRSVYRYGFIARPPIVSVSRPHSLRLVCVCHPLAHHVPHQHLPSPPFQARPQALLVPLSCQLPLSCHWLLPCMLHNTIAPPPPPLYSIMIKFIFYQTLTPVKTYEPPPCQRRSIRLRPKASPAYARGPAPLALCLGPFLLSPLLLPPFPLTRLMVFYPRLVPPLNKTGLDKTSQDRIRQDPNKQDGG